MDLVRLSTDLAKDLAGGHLRLFSWRRTLSDSIECGMPAHGLARTSQGYYALLGTPTGSFTLYTISHLYENTHVFIIFVMMVYGDFRGIREDSWVVSIEWNVYCVSINYSMRYIAHFDANLDVVDIYQSCTILSYTWQL